MPILTVINGAKTLLRFSRYIEELGVLEVFIRSFNLASGFWISQETQKEEGENG